MEPIDIVYEYSMTHERLTDLVTASLESRGIDYETEHWLDDDSRVDVFYDGIVIEIKSSIGVIDDEKLTRYEAHPEVSEVALCLPEPMAQRVETGERRVITVPREKFNLSL